MSESHSGLATDTSHKYTPLESVIDIKQILAACRDCVKAAQKLPLSHEYDAEIAHTPLASKALAIKGNLWNYISNLGTISSHRASAHLFKHTVHDSEQYSIVSNSIYDCLERSNRQVEHVNRAKIDTHPTHSELNNPFSTSIVGGKLQKNATALSQYIKQSKYSPLEKPQVHFDPPVDNSYTPFRPIIRHKPNAIVDLDQSIISGQLPLPSSDSTATNDYNVEGEHSTPTHYAHPYYTEITQLTYHPRHIEPESVITYQPLTASPCFWIDTLTDLERLEKTLNQSSIFAIDVEHHSQRTYQGITCLIQISTLNEDFLVDTIALRQYLSILNTSFTNPNITKVLHGCSMDIIWLQRDLGLYLVNVFDTGQASQLLDFPQYSLAALLEHYCNVHADKTYQTADWRIRPLNREMLVYAREDTHYLIYIYQHMKNQLIEKSKLLYASNPALDPVQLYGKEAEIVLSTTNTPSTQHFLLNRCLNRSARLTLQRYEKPNNPTVHTLSIIQRLHINDINHIKLFIALYIWRDQKARVLDESPTFLMNTNSMAMLAKQGNTINRMDRLQAILQPVNILLRPYLPELLIFLHFPWSEHVPHTSYTSFLQYNQSSLASLSSSLSSSSNNNPSQSSSSQTPSSSSLAVTPTAQQLQSTYALLRQHIIDTLHQSFTHNISLLDHILPSAVSSSSSSSSSSTVTLTATGNSTAPTTGTTSTTTGTTPTPTAITTSTETTSTDSTTATTNAISSTIFSQDLSTTLSSVVLPNTPQIRDSFISFLGWSTSALTTYNSTLDQLFNANYISAQTLISAALQQQQTLPTTHHGLALFDASSLAESMKLLSTSTTDNDDKTHIIASQLASLAQNNHTASQDSDVSLSSMDDGNTTTSTSTHKIIIPSIGSSSSQSEQQHIELNDALSHAISELTQYSTPHKSKSSKSSSNDSTTSDSSSSSSLLRQRVNALVQPPIKPQQNSMVYNNDIDNTTTTSNEQYNPVQSVDNDINTIEYYNSLSQNSNILSWDTLNNPDSNNNNISHTPMISNINTLSSPVPQPQYHGDAIYIPQQHGKQGGSKNTSHLPGHMMQNPASAKSRIIELNHQQISSVPTQIDAIYKISNTNKARGGGGNSNNTAVATTATSGNADDKGDKQDNNTTGPQKKRSRGNKDSKDNKQNGNNSLLLDHNNINNNNTTSSITMNDIKSLSDSALLDSLGWSSSSSTAPATASAIPSTSSNNNNNASSSQQSSTGQQGSISSSNDTTTSNQVSNQQQSRSGKRNKQQQQQSNQNPFVLSDSNNPFATNKGMAGISAPIYNPSNASSTNTKRKK